MHLKNLADTFVYHLQYTHVYIVNK